MPDIHALMLYVSLFISLFFEVFLLITYLEVKDEIKLEDEWLKADLKCFPGVSVIVPCFNEERMLSPSSSSTTARPTAPSMP
jgi:cellulose synthase/poly-beta-1,6-N-acetylglucosamine synthase-like glycosyltransferase